MKNPTLDDLIAQIRAAKRIALLLHISPDGDTCGSALALRRALSIQGKDVVAVCDHPVPQIYQDLDGADEVCLPRDAGDPFDLAIAVDVADRLRLGESVAVFDAARHTAQIDHHLTNPGYAEVNYLRSPLSATGVLALEVIDGLGAPIDLPTAQCLFVAVATDTGNFKQQNTDAAGLRLGARCVEVGVDPSTVARRVFDMRPLAQVKLLARALQSMEVFRDGSLSIMCLRKEDFEETGALPEHTEGVVNFGINTEGVRITCLLSQAGQKVKGSLRSVPPYEVSRIATDLGGGGHNVASGFSLEPPMEEIYACALAEMEKELDRHG